jgi:hypothetical protein
MRCPDCNKFVSLEMSEPEINEDLDSNDEGEITGSVRIVRTCAECGTELKEATLELKGDISEELPEKPTVAEGATAPTYEVTIEVDGTEALEEGGGRYKKSFFGAEISFTATCSWDPEWKYDGTVSEKIAASHMEELA